MDIFGIAFKDLLRVGAYLFQQDVQRLFQLQRSIGGQYAYGYQRWTRRRIPRYPVPPDDSQSKESLNCLNADLLACANARPSAACFFVSSAGRAALPGLRSYRPGKQRRRAFNLKPKYACRSGYRCQ